MDDNQIRSSPDLRFSSISGRRYSLAVFGLVVLSFLLMIAAPGLSLLGYIAATTAMESPSDNVILGVWGVMAMVEAALVELGGTAAVTSLFIRKTTVSVWAIRTLLAATTLGSVSTTVAMGAATETVVATSPSYQSLIFRMMFVLCILPSTLTAVLSWLDLVCLKRVRQQREAALS